MGQLEAQNLWERVCVDLSSQQEISNPMAEAYLSYLVPRDVDETTLTVLTRLTIAKQWIESRYMPFINEAIVRTLGSPRQVQIIVSNEVSIPAAQTLDPLTTDPLVEAVSSTMPTVTAALSSSMDTPLNQEKQQSLSDNTEQMEHNKKTFENFVSGSSNDFAYSAARGVAEMPGSRFNPLFIYGRSGLGKTHLLLAIKEDIKHYLSNRKVVYAQTSEFVNDFTSAMASINKDLTDFRIKYHMCDVLLLDDVQYLEGKESTTNALFDIFNLFIAQRKQIVLSADRAPNELNIDERFASRFAQGLTAGIQPPSFEMKMAIFSNLTKYYCRQFGVENITIPQDVADHIIELSSSNIRELEGATSTIIGYISHQKNERRNSTITVEEAEQIVGKVFLHNGTKQIDIHSIQKEVASYFKISYSDMKGTRRSKNISYPRQVAMYLSRRLTTKSYPEIGRMFGGKDHTSVLYAYNNIEKKMSEDLNRKIEIERLAEMITS